LYNCIFFSSSLSSHQIFYHIFLQIIFTFIPLNFLSSFSLDHLHFYPIKLSRRNRTSVPEPLRTLFFILFYLSFCEQFKFYISNFLFSYLNYQKLYFRRSTPTKPFNKLFFNYKVEYENAMSDFTFIFLLCSHKTQTNRTIKEKQTNKNCRALFIE